MSDYTPPALATPVSIPNGGTGSATAVAAREALELARFIAVLANDFSVNNSATLVDITGMTMSLVAGTYLVHAGVVFSDANATNGHKVNFYFGGTSCFNSASSIGGITNAAPGTTNWPWPASNTVGQALVNATAGFQYAGHRMEMMIVVPSTITLTLQLAESSAGATTTMKAGSWMSAVRMA